MGGHAVIHEQGVQERAEHSALRVADVEGQSGGCASDRALSLAPVNPGLLIRECPYGNPRYDVIDTFAKVANDCVRVCLCCCPETHTTL